MLINKSFTMKLSGAYQTYQFSSSMGVDTNSPEDLKQLEMEIGSSFSQFESVSKALSYITQADVLGDISAFYESDADFKKVWNARAADLFNIK